MSAIARPAATTILVRPAPGEPEVFMLRRSARSAFMPDVYVFPGGALDAQDSEEPAISRIRGLDAGGAQALFRDVAGLGAAQAAAALDPRQRLGLLVTAARELYEEAGVLLAVDRAGARLEQSGAAAATLEAKRSAVARGEIAFAALLEEFDIWIDASAFVYFSHWITPLVEPRRFDAYFFLAAARSGEAAAADAHETHDGVWIAPQDALARCEAGNFALMFPTIEHLKRLAGYSSVEALIAFGRTKRVVAVMPEMNPEGPRFAVDDLVGSTW